MTDTRDPISAPSVVERTQLVSTPRRAAGRSRVHFLGEHRGFRAGRGGAAARAAETATERRVAVHGGGILASAADGDAHHHRRRRRQGAWRPTRRARAASLATDAKHRWIDHVALGPSGAVAWSAGKQAFVRTGKGDERSARAALDRRRARVRAERLSARDRALQRRDALVSERARPRPSCSTGRARISASPSARTDASWSPPCRSRRCTAGGSPTARTCACRATRARVRSLDWTRRRQMARDVGLDAAHPVAVPSQGRPDGQDSRACWRRWSAQVEVVACHPKQEIVAVGYADGLVLLVRIEDGAEILAREAGATRRSRRSPGAPTASCWRSGPRTARPALLDAADDVARRAISS